MFLFDKHLFQAGVPGTCCFFVSNLQTRICPPPFWIKPCLGGGNSKIFGIFIPNPWGNDPIWLLHFIFQMGWFIQPPSSCSSTGWWNSSVSPSCWQVPYGMGGTSRSVDIGRFFWMTFSQLKKGASLGRFFREGLHTAELWVFAAILDPFFSNKFSFFFGGLY